MTASDPQPHGSYEDLRSLVEKVAHAAIQAEMSYNYDCSLHGDHYVHRASGYVVTSFPGPGGPPTGVVTLRAEPSAGLGDTQESDIHFDPTADVYEPWTQAVEDVFRDWHDLPNPYDSSRFSGPATSVEDAISVLACGGQVPGETSKPSGNALAARLSFVVSELAPFNAATVDAFSKNFLTWVAPSCMNDAVAGAALAAAYRTEEQIWIRSRKAITLIAEQAAKAMYPIGTDAKAGWTVLGIMQGVVGLLVSGPVGAVVGVANTLLSTVEKATSLIPATPDTRELHGPNMQVVLDNTAAAVKKLNERIRTEEQAVWEILDAMLQEMSGATGSEPKFAPPRPDDLFSETDPTDLVTAREEVYVDPGKLRTIGNDDMRFVGEQIRNTAKAIDVFPGSSAFGRPSSIGLGPTGPSGLIEVLTDALTTVLLNMGQHCIDAGEVLAIAADAFSKTDAHVRDRLEQHRKEIADDLGPGDPTAHRDRPGREYA
ncbi:hypothetical protein ACFV9G_26840 [Nocardioides sp. NPDC059952]|uniref:hypothetical protein n=1 Tax=Nocardioides sp. NPDC059952 TaxID=3347014 RepID=UPI0036630F2F